MIIEFKKMFKLGTKYFCLFYNYIDLIIIGFAWASFSMYLYRLYSSYNIYGIINKNRNDLQNIQINLQYIENCDKLLNYFLGFCAAFSSLRFIKLLRFNKRIIVYLVAFKKSLKELVSFSIIFIVVWLSFVQAFFIILNHRLVEFSSILASMKSSFQMIMGKHSYLFNASNNILEPCLYVLFVVCILFIMLNIFITILYDNYVLACNDKDLDKEDPELFDYLKQLFGSFFLGKMKKIRKNLFTVNSGTNYRTNLMKF